MVVIVKTSITGPPRSCSYHNINYLFEPHVVNHFTRMTYMACGFFFIYLTTKLRLLSPKLPPFCEHIHTPITRKILRINFYLSCFATYPTITHPQEILFCDNFSRIIYYFATTFTRHPNKSTLLSILSVSPCDIISSNPSL